MSARGDLPVPDARQGNQRTVQTLVQIVYPELRRLAQYYLQRERPDHTLQATALVHEAYLQLAVPGASWWLDRAHFFAAAARAMRNLLVDYARARGRAKRDGGCRLSLDEAATLAAAQDSDVLALNEALDRLAKFDERQAQVVEMRYFGGLSIAEVAASLDISERTVKYDWQMARAWLYNELREAR